MGGGGDPFLGWRESVGNSRSEKTVYVERKTTNLPKEIKKGEFNVRDNPL